MGGAVTGVGASRVFLNPRARGRHRHGRNHASYGRAGRQLKKMRHIMKRTEGNLCPRAGAEEAAEEAGGVTWQREHGQELGDREAKGGDRTSDASRLTKDQREGLRSISYPWPRRPHAASPCGLGGVATDTQGTFRSREEARSRDHQLCRPFQGGCRARGQREHGRKCGRRARYPPGKAQGLPSAVGKGPPAARGVAAEPRHQEEWGPGLWARPRRGQRWM